jgi:hypothetical protein
MPQISTLAVSIAIHHTCGTLYRSCKSTIDGAGTVLQFKFNEGQDLSTLYYREIKTSLGGREGGVTFVEYSKVTPSLLTGRIHSSHPA